MKTTNEVLKELTDASSVMQDVTDTLRQVDPSFQEEETRYNHALLMLGRDLNRSTALQLENYLKAKKELLAASIVYMGWQGFQLNLRIFQDPVQALILQEDFEEICQERNLASLPAVIIARNKMQVFLEMSNSFSKAQMVLLEEISDYYVYLETVGYKLAHYVGFRLADSFLYQVVPGYTRSDNMERYSLALRNYLQFDLRQII